MMKYDPKHTEEKSWSAGRFATEMIKMPAVLVFSFTYFLLYNINIKVKKWKTVYGFEHPKYHT